MSCKGFKMFPICSRTKDSSCFKRLTCSCKDAFSDARCLFWSIRDLDSSGFEIRIDLILAWLRLRTELVSYKDFLTVLNSLSKSTTFVIFSKLPPLNSSLSLIFFKIANSLNILTSSPISKQ